MATSTSRVVFPTTLAATLLAALVPASAAAGPQRVVQNPNHVPNPDPVVLDFRTDEARARNFETSFEQGASFSQLDQFASDRPDEDVAPQADSPYRMPGGMAQVGSPVGSMVVPEAMLDGAQMVSNADRVLSQEGGPVAGGGAPDLEDICAFPEEVPPGIYDYDARPGGETPRFHTVYLNYVGATLSTGGENSAENLSSIARSGHPYPVYSGGEMRAIAAAQAVSADFEDWAVRVVYEERPPNVLPYTMVMMGGHYSDTTAGPSGGVAPLDCEDFGQRNVCYVFQNTSPAITQANIASQEIGHTLGLGHTNASDSVMAAGYAPTQGGDLGFNDSCAPIIAVSGQSAACVGVNRCHCGVPDSQHDKNTLFATFAPAGVDMIEPTIDITSPADGAVYEEGSDVIIEVDPWDDVGGYGWKLILEDENGEILVDKVDYDRALEFKLVGVPVGVYAATAYIQDHADHVTTHTITFTVEAASAESDSETGGESNGDSGSSGDPNTSGGSGSESESDGDGSGGNEDDSGGVDAGTGGDSGGGATGNDDGCGCTSGEAPPASWMLVLLAAGALRRRKSA